MGIDPEVDIRLLRKGAVPPKKMSDGSAGFDITACIESEIVIAPGKWASIPSGIALAIPDGYEGEIRPRSGIAAKFGVTLLNSPGTIDSDYRGEVSAIIINHGAEPFIVRNGDRIAQLLIKPVEKIAFNVVEKLTDTERGDGGFGSTGLHSLETKD
ncbi:dUTP diphosphatase [bacterium]|nr:MAG: dUTP diphosphatase [bacterium]